MAMCLDHPLNKGFYELFLLHNQLLSHNIIGCHHSDEVDTGCQVLNVHLTAVVVDALAQYSFAVVVINRQFANHVERRANGEDMVGRVGVEGDVLIEVMHVNAAAWNNDKGDMNYTVAAIHGTSGHINVQCAGVLRCKVQTVVIVLDSNNSRVGYIHLISLVNSQIEHVNAVATIDSFVVLDIPTGGVAVDTVPYEVDIATGTGGINECITAVDCQYQIDNAVATSGILINTL